MDSAIKQAKDMLFSDTSVDIYLSRLFGNYGVARPIANPSDDVMYRQIGQLLATQPKTRGIRVVYQLLEILFGTQASLVAVSRRPWQIYETKPNVLTVEVPQDLIVAGLANATYLHGLGGYDGSSGAGTTNQLLVYRSEDFTRAAVPMAGLSIYINNVQHTITGITYDATQGLNTFTTLDNITANLVSARWYVNIPAANSFTGSYLVPDANTSESTVDDQPAIAFGPGLVDIFVQYMTQIAKAAGVVLDVQLVSPGYVRPNPTPPVTLVSITIAPAAPTLAHTVTQQFTATGHYSDGSTANLTTQVLWSSSDITKATIGNGENALVPEPLNGNFETGDFTGWLLSNGGVVASTFNGISPHDGNFMGVVGGNTGGFPVVCTLQRDPSQKIELPNPPEAGCTYTLSFWYALVEVDFGTPQNDQLCTLLDHTGALLATIFHHGPAINQAFTQFTLDVTSFVGVEPLNLEFTVTNQGGGPWAAILVDSVQVTRTPATNAQGLERGVAAGQTVITAKFPSGPAGTTLLTLT